MTVKEWLDRAATSLADEGQRVMEAGLDAPVSVTHGRLLQTVGTLHLYQFTLPSGLSLPIDLPVSIIPGEELEPTEGVIVQCHEGVVTIQTLDAIGSAVPFATLVPDRAGHFQTISGRLAEMQTKADAYNLGPAERLVPLLLAGGDPGSTQQGSASVLSTLWLEDPGIRRQKLATMIIDLVRANKRILLLSPDHPTADELAGVIARAMKMGGLTYKTWMSRYEMTVGPHAAGLPIQELGFEAQMHQFYAKSRAEKASLRRKYERFRELTPLLAYKGQKQKDLDEVRLLEWRLLTQLSDVQAKIKTVSDTLTEYENLPLWRRLGMQTVGKNVESLQQYRVLYNQQIQELTKELAVAKARIDELVPEAAVPKDLRPEFEDLKEDIKKLGGTKKIRELLAAEEDTNRQAFIQNRRLLIATPGRIGSDPLFTRVRFDVLIAEQAPWIDTHLLLAAAGLVRERIIMSGDVRDVPTAGRWTLPEGHTASA